MAKRSKKFTSQGIANESYDDTFRVKKVALFGWDGSNYVAVKVANDGSLDISDVENLSTSLAANSVVFSDGSNLTESNPGFTYDGTTFLIGANKTNTEDFQIISTGAGVHIVLAPIAATTFEITSTDSTNATGTTDQAATLEADAVAAGVYDFAYYMSAVPVGNNETFDFQLYNKATAITGSKIRRKFGASGDFGSMSAGGVVSIASGDKLSLAISNEDSAANLTIRNLTIVLVRL